MKRFIYALLTLTILLFSCSEDPEPLREPTHRDDDTDTTESFTTDTTKLYIPLEFRNIDFTQASSTWSFSRCRQSEHFIVFWGKGYGTNDPDSSVVPSAYRVDIDDLLAKAEQFYTLNVNTLKFAEPGKSNLDKYKMLIFLYYESEWRATGSGYDDVIGALWISPSTCQPVGPTIAHEIGHSFQYQVHCDLKGGTGFRYGFGGNGGNTFWEQTAQWQAFQSYPTEAFATNHFSEYTNHYFRHTCNEAYRYASYFIHYYWTYKHGVDFIGKLWREAQQPEDPIQAYMRINGITVDQFNDEIYDAAARLVTWDIDAIRNIGQNYIGAQSCKMVSLGNAEYRPDTSFCVEPTGYNAIPLNVPTAGTEISAVFAATPSATGYRTDNSMLGFRYGFVALMNNNSRVYDNIYNTLTGTATFTVPAGCTRLWFIVSGASPTYKPHAWDDNRSNDVQLPYTVQFVNTNLFGTISFDGTETPMDTTLTFNVEFPYSATVYPGATVKLDQAALVKLARAFVLQPDEIIAKTAQSGKPIKLYAVENNGNLIGNYTCSSDAYVNVYGHYFTAQGNVCGWSDATSRVFSEFAPAQLSFTVGQYPGRCTSGDKYTIKQALVYGYEAGKSVQATFVFNITIN
jgi:hypothetical protein